MKFLGRDNTSRSEQFSQAPIYRIKFVGLPAQLVWWGTLQTWQDVDKHSYFKWLFP